MPCDLVKVRHSVDNMMDLGCESLCESAVCCCFKIVLVVYLAGL